MKKLTEAAFQSAAKELDVEPAVIKAVCEVEAPKGGFLPDGRVTILFERHKFHQYTHGIYSKEHPDISNPRAGGYGAAGAHQWDRFEAAAELDSEAAMEATSWGKFQIMGSNYGSAGYHSVDDFVGAMKLSEDEQLKAFIQIVKSFGLVDELRNHDWAGFARGYNGANYHINEYDIKLKRAYLKHKADEPEIDDAPDQPETPSTAVEVKTNPVTGEVTKTIPTNEIVVPPPQAVDSGSKKSLWATVIAIPGMVLAYVSQNIGEALGFLKDRELLKWFVIGATVIFAIYLFRQIVMSVVKQVGAIWLTHQSMKYHADPNSNNVSVAQPAPAKEVAE